MQAVQMVSGPPPGPRGPPLGLRGFSGPRGPPPGSPSFFHMPRLPSHQFKPQMYQSRYRHSQQDQAQAGGGNVLFDGKRMRKAVHRKTVDYNSSVIKYLENRVWQRDFRDNRQIQPDRLYTLDLTPPSCMLNNQMNCVTTKFVRTSTNKFRCPIFVLTWTPEGRRLVTGASSGEFTLWNGLTFNFETILQAHDTSVRAMQWSHNDSWMVTADHAGFVKYWQSNMNNVKMYQGHKEAVRGISFCPTDSKFATCSDDGTVRVWDFMKCYEERILRGHGSDVKCVDWHPQKGLLASGSKDSQQPVKLWDPKSGTSLATIHGHKSTVMSLKWNRNGNWLLTASRDHLLKVFDIRNMKEEMQTFKGHKKEATAVAWHPIHESLFASGGSDGAIMFWLVGTDKEVGGMEEAHEGMVWSMAWHPLGHILASGSNDHSTKFWTRNRPGDLMRDKYNLNTLPAGTEQELLEYDLEPQNIPSIPGMGLEHGLPEHLQPKDKFEENLPAIPGLNWMEDENFYKQQAIDNVPRKKIPYSRPVPKVFELAWKENKLPVKHEPPSDEQHKKSESRPRDDKKGGQHQQQRGNSQNRNNSAGPGLNNAGAKQPPHLQAGILGPAPGMFVPGQQADGMQRTPIMQQGSRGRPSMGGPPQQTGNARSQQQIENPPSSHHQDMDDRHGGQPMGMGQDGPGNSRQMRGPPGGQGPMDQTGRPHGGPGQARGPHGAPFRGPDQRQPGGDEDLRRHDQDLRQQGPPEQDRWQKERSAERGEELYDAYADHQPPGGQDQDYRALADNSRDRDLHYDDGGQGPAMRDQGLRGPPSQHAQRNPRGMPRGQGAPRGAPQRPGESRGPPQQGYGGGDGWDNGESRDFDDRRGGGGSGNPVGQDIDYRFTGQEGEGEDGYWDHPQNQNNRPERGRGGAHRGVGPRGGYPHGPPRGGGGGGGGYEDYGDYNDRSGGGREQSPHQFGPPEGMRKRTYDEGPGRGRGQSNPNMQRGGRGSFRGHSSTPPGDHMDMHGPKYGRHDPPSGDYDEQYSGRPPPTTGYRGNSRGAPRGRGEYRGRGGYRGGPGRGGPRGQ